jgi:hypothetical protein
MASFTYKSAGSILFARFCQAKSVCVRGGRGRLRLRRRSSSATSLLAPSSSPSQEREELTKEFAEELNRLSNSLINTQERVQIRKNLANSAPSNSNCKVLHPPAVKQTFQPPRPPCSPSPGQIQRRFSLAGGAPAPGCGEGGLWGCGGARTRADGRGLRPRSHG